MPLSFALRTTCLNRSTPPILPGLIRILSTAGRPEGVTADPCYAGISRDGVWIHLSSFSGDGVVGSVVNLMVDNVDKFYEEFTAKNVPIDVAPVDQTWGSREMYVKDADGNCLRFIA